MDQSTAQEENRLLRQLSAEDLALLRPHLKTFLLEQGQILHPAGAEIRHVYFPLSGMVSLLALMRTGEAIETGIIGKEGVVCGSIGTEGWQSFGQAIVQIPGRAWQIASADFLRAFAANERLRKLVNRFQSAVLLQAQQSAACHAVHTVEARLCRWLLQSQDTVQSDVITLTQEFLSYMLGVQRSSVSLAAHSLQESGLIRYNRGRVEILNRAGLEECACECYDVLRKHFERAAAQS